MIVNGFAGLEVIPFDFEGLTDAELHGLCPHISNLRMQELRERLAVRKAQLESVYLLRPGVAEDMRRCLSRELVQLWRLPNGDHEHVAFAQYRAHP
jgi:hypothetical protein